MTTVDIVIAVCNEEAAIPPFVQKIRALEVPEDVAVRLLFVEDSSTDGTVSVLRRLAESDPGVRFVSLERGFGQAAALWFGLRESDADAVITMDVDDAHPVPLIPDMIAAYRSGADLVQGVRRELKGRAAYRNFGTRVFRIAASVLTGFDVARQNVHYRLVSRKAREMIICDPRRVYFMKFNPELPGLRTEYVTFEAAERTVGRSKYSLRRLAAHSVNGILAMMPAGRVWAVAAGLAAAGVLLAWRVWLPAGVLVCAAAAFLLVRYFRMCHNRIPARMRARLRG
ncbi:MAG: glycosyltransferase [Lentisphaerae bacterium]|nr:glycosyltransferase [Lentisphaerota bacterium]